MLKRWEAHFNNGFRTRLLADISRESLLNLSLIIEKMDILFT